MKLTLNVDPDGCCAVCAHLKYLSQIDWCRKRKRCTDLGGRCWRYTRAGISELRHRAGLHYENMRASMSFSPSGRPLGNIRIGRSALLDAWKRFQCLPLDLIGKT